MDFYHQHCCKVSYSSAVVFSASQRETSTAAVIYKKPLPFRLVTNKDAGKIFLPPYSETVHLDVLQKQALLVTKISPINQNHISSSAVPASFSSSSPKKPCPLGSHKTSAAALYSLLATNAYVLVAREEKKPFNGLQLLLLAMNMLHSLLSSTRFLRYCYCTLSTGIIKTKPSSSFENSSFSPDSP